MELAPNDDVEGVIFKVKGQVKGNINWNYPLIMMERVIPL